MGTRARSGYLIRPYCRPQFHAAFILCRRRVKLRGGPPEGYGLRHTEQSSRWVSAPQVPAESCSSPNANNTSIQKCIAAVHTWEPGTAGMALGWAAAVGAPARLARRARPRTDRMRARAVRATAGSVIPHVSEGVARLEEFARRPGKKAVFQAAQSGVIIVVR